MPIEFPSDRETSTGPLDVAHPDDRTTPLDLSATHTTPDDETLLEKQKNPLGYTVTEPTEEEIDVDDIADKAAP